MSYIIKSKNIEIKCSSAWDIFDAVIKLTDSELEAKTAWKIAGRMNPKEEMGCNDYSIKRVS